MKGLHPHTEQWADDDLVFDNHLLEESFSVTGPDPAENFECLNCCQFLI